MKIATDPRFLAAGFTAGTLSRHAGNMAEIKNQEDVYTRFHINPAHILHLHQVHGNKLITVSSLQQSAQIQQNALQAADGWLLSPTVSGWGAAILTADCVPLFVWNASGTHAALAHCGWRGIVQELPFQTARAIMQTGAQGPFYAWAGPHIQKCCFEVQQDTAEKFPQETIVKNGKLFVDLNQAVRAQLLRAGLHEKDIVLSSACTCCDEENFFSWRRDHIRNLLLSFIYKK